MGQDNQGERGWGLPYGSKLNHYFVKRKSLCGRWEQLGAVFDDDHESCFNCKTCKQLRAELAARESKFFWDERRVLLDGTIFFRGDVYRVPDHLVGRHVRVEEASDSTLLVEDVNAPGEKHRAVICQLTAHSSEPTANNSKE